MAIRGKSQTLDHVLSELIDTYKLRGKLDEVELHRFWAELLGPQINAQTEGLYLQGEKVGAVEQLGIAVGTEHGKRQYFSKD